MIFNFLGLFFNALTADDKCSLLNTKKLTQSIQMKLSKKHFVNSFTDFLNTDEILSIFF